MSTSLTTESVARALSQAVSDAWGSTPAGAPASVGAGAAPSGDGWSVAVPVAGAASGTLHVWFERASASACAARALSLDGTPADDAVTGVLTQLVTRAMEALETSPDGAGLTSFDPTAKAGTVPAGAKSFVSQWADVQCAFAIVVDLNLAAGASAPAAAVPASGLAAALAAGITIDDSRLEAVLDVDLPLVVRFGRAVMPLRAVADLSPGSVVDMGRSPDEPVEMLVGERLIARGEVVIVGGNYGVRITELTNGRRATDLEARS